MIFVIIIRNHIIDLAFFFHQNMRKRQKGSKPGLQYEKVGCQFGVLPTKEVGPVPSFEPELNSSRMFCTEQARTCLFKYLCRCVKVAKPEDVLIDTGR